MSTTIPIGWMTLGAAAVIAMLISILSLLRVLDRDKFKNRMIWLAGAVTFLLGVFALANQSLTIPDLSLELISWI